MNKTAFTRQALPHVRPLRLAATLLLHGSVTRTGASRNRLHVRRLGADESFNGGRVSADRLGLDLDRR